MAITSAFQADDAGSIPATRSIVFIQGKAVIESGSYSSVGRALPW